MERNLKFLSVYPLPALLTPLPRIPFATEEITGCTIYAVKGANEVARNPPSCFFISCFTVSVTPSINTHESSNDFIVSIILFISSFEINKVNPFLALITPFSLIFLSNLFIAFEVKLLANPGKLCLGKGIATFVGAFFLKLPNQNQNINLIDLF